MEHPARPPERAREVLLAEAERIARMGSWVWDCRTGAHEWSANLYHLLGFDPGAVTPSNELFHGVIHDEDREHVQAAMARSAEEEAAPDEPVEYRVVLPSGEIRTLHSRVIAVRDDDGELLRFVGTVTDETATIARRRERENAREFIEVSQQIAKIGSWTWDPVADSVEWSSETHRIIGTDDELSIAAFAEMLQPEDVPTLLDMREQVFATGSAGPATVRITRPDGDHRHVEMQVRTAGDPQTSPHVGIIHDITERVHLEQELRLSQTLEATGRLAAGVAHDFNNLLMVVMNSALDLAGERPDARLDEIVTATRSGAEMVRRLLAFGHHESSDSPVIDLGETVRDVAGWLDRVLGDSVVVELSLVQEPVLVQADPAQLHQVLLNLGVNARDAMPTGGTVGISTAVTEDRVLLTVQDEGTGMTDAIRRRAFDPFFTTKAVGEGTGLGLSMAYGVVARLGGSVQISSEPDHGTHVTIELPRVKDDDAQAPQETPSATSGTRCTVLLIEDDDAVRSVTKRILERGGHTVVAAADPDEAIAHWTDVRPDVVLSDLAMPKGGGVRVAELLERDHPTVPIVFMTGHLPEEGTLRGLTLLKPFTSEDLHRAIDEALADLR